jgi:hypothetical protein
MKITIIFSALTLALTGCLKSTTCTCKDPSGKVVQQQTKKSLYKSDIKKYNEDCEKNGIKTTTSSGTTVTPCEVS